MNDLAHRVEALERLIAGRIVAVTTMQEQAITLANAISQRFAELNQLETEIAALLDLIRADRDELRAIRTELAAVEQDSAADWWKSGGTPPV